MKWVDKQIRSRLETDQQNFEGVFSDLAGVVMGKKSNSKILSEKEKVTNAIAEILKYYRVQPEPLPEEIHSVNDQLEYLLRPSGVMRREVELTGKWYKDSVGPLLGFLKDGTPVALLPCGMNSYRYFDWETKKEVRLNEKTAHFLRTDAFCFYRPLPSKKLVVSDLFQYILRTLTPSDYGMLIGTTLAVTLLGLLSPMITKLIYAQIIPSGVTGLLLPVFTMLLGVAVSTALISIVKNLIVSRIQTQLSISVESAAMARVLSLPASFFKQYGAGDLASRTQGISRLCTTFVSTVLTTGLSSVFSLVYLGQVFSFAPVLVVPSLIITLLSLLVTVVTALYQLTYSRKEMKASIKNAGIVYSLLSGIQKIKLSGAERRAFIHWSKSYEEQARYQYDKPLLIKIGPALSTIISLAGTIFVYYFAARGNVSVANYMAFNSAFGMVAGAMTSMAGISLTLAQIRPSLEMVEPILQAEPEVAVGKQVLTKVSGGIELTNVSFRYTEDGPMILDGLSINIRPGQYVAIVGETGCGKSTLMRLMLGFEKPLKGAVYYDGHDMEKIDLKSLRHHIGVVMQNGKLFQGDIYSNIVISAPQLSQKEAWEAAETAGIAEDIRAMPMGMQTLISEGGGGISGGQRQRLMIARAIAPKPKILLFDEATSALDNLTQRKVSESLDQLKSTRIVIAHRLSTIRHCDRILVLEHGKIVADGNYDELLHSNAYFAQLVRRQQVNS